ncbi:hypothetical protein OA93_23005 [Flavobacterium sp. KMS]|uniref:hypothetical protein n=1 Tax=Flavobacterium sp. KMS TaxID=1566023 RepID=UPI0005806854|nr:hypothetical protein [Flavobacterium sp. KMS]KIA92678.1 hypothetical protein OA93_23005 [Flavobacterium sp. KMS]
MEKKLFILCLILFSLLGYSQTQVGINTLNPNQTLDVNGRARIRTMTNVNTEALTLEYNNRVVSNSDGILGYVVNNSSTTVPWSFNDNKNAVLSSPISSQQRGGTVNLNFSITVTIPAKSQSQVVVKYNMPVMHSSRRSGTIGYVGCTLFKSVNGGSDVELEMGSRKYTVVGSYKGPSEVTALGLPISGFAVDIISNPGNIPMDIVYKVDGYVEFNYDTVTFGMLTASSEDNANWGRGAMSARIFTKPVN